MIYKFLLSIVMTAFLLQGCASQSISHHLAKGALVREDPSGKVLYQSRTPTIDLVSPCAVRIGEKVERQEETVLYYQKLLMKKEATPRSYPYLDAYFKFVLATAVIPVFTPSYWVQGSYAGPDCIKNPGTCDIRDVSEELRGQYVVEQGSRTVIERASHASTNGNVSIFMNGYYRGDIPVDPDGVARIAIQELPGSLNSRADLKITFKYFNVYAYSLIKRSDLEALQANCRSGSIPRPLQESAPLP